MKAETKPMAICRRQRALVSLVLLFGFLAACAEDVIETRSEITPEQANAEVNRRLELAVTRYTDVLAEIGVDDEMMADLFEMLETEVFTAETFESNQSGAAVHRLTTEPFCDDETGECPAQAIWLHSFWTEQSNNLQIFATLAADGEANVSLEVTDRSLMLQAELDGLVDPADELSWLTHVSGALEAIVSVDESGWTHLVVVITRPITLGLLVNDNPMEIRIEAAELLALSLTDENEIDEVSINLPAMIASTPAQTFDSEWADGDTIALNTTAFSLNGRPTDDDSGALEVDAAGLDEPWRLTLNGVDLARLEFNDGWPSTFRIEQDERSDDWTISVEPFFYLKLSLAMAPIVSLFDLPEWSADELLTVVFDGAERPTMSTAPSGDDIQVTSGRLHFGSMTHGDVVVETGQCLVGTDSSSDWSHPFAALRSEDCSR